MSDTSLILIVDEDQNFREIFSRELKAAGFRVETADGGQHGVEKAKQLKPDLVLMDVQMPGMDGVATVMKMKEDPETKDIKVIFLTAFGNQGDEIQRESANFSKEIGAMGYIHKTDDLKDIVSKVKKFLN
ncbi:MAG: response regulator [Candidatus Liptonbacteria bacterium]|nr:response regulator [Candidatus Liptonbacteria bacterium]